jgi:hypothetical protein
MKEAAVFKPDCNQLVGWSSSNMPPIKFSVNKPLPCRHDMFPQRTHRGFRYSSRDEVPEHLCHCTCVCTQCAPCKGEATQGFNQTSNFQYIPDGAACGCAFGSGTGSPGFQPGGMGGRFASASGGSGRSIPGFHPGGMGGSSTGMPGFHPGGGLARPLGFSANRRQKLRHEMHDMGRFPLVVLFPISRRHGGRHGLINKRKTAAHVEGCLVCLRKAC